MNNKHTFWLAAFFSAFFHAAVFGCLFLADFWKVLESPPMLVMIRGDSDRDGLPVETVALAPGTFRKGDKHTPGGDGAPKTPDVKPAPTPAPAPPPVIVKPVPKPIEKPIPKPIEKPPVIVKPIPKPVEKPSSTETPAKGPSPSAPSAPIKPLETQPPVVSASSGGTGSGLPGASGGSRFPIGTPSAGGTVGSRSGVRLPTGVRPPPYPPEAREAGIEGVPVIWLRISPEGKVLESRIHTSCGYRILDKAAFEWTKNLHYHPARRDNIPVEGEILHPVNFYLF